MHRRMVMWLGAGLTTAVAVAGCGAAQARDTANTNTTQVHVRRHQPSPRLLNPPPPLKVGSTDPACRAVASGYLPGILGVAAGSSPVLTFSNLSLVHGTIDQCQVTNLRSGTDTFVNLEKPTNANLAIVRAGTRGSRTLWTAGVAIHRMRPSDGVYVAQAHGLILEVTNALSAQTARPVRGQLLAKSLHSVLLALAYWSQHG